MSALEQIRKRPGLIISILGLALVLFIFTAISNPEKLFSDPSTIAKVNGKKIDYSEYQNRHDELRRDQEQRINQENQRRAQQGLQPISRDIPTAQLQEAAMQSLIQEALIDEMLQKVGITVTGEELGKAMLGDQIPMAVQQLYWQRQQQGLYSGRDLHELAFNPSAYQLGVEESAQFKAEWMDLEKQVADMLRQQKFYGLMQGILVANDLDAQAQYDENNYSTQVRLAKVDALTVPDADVEVTDADIKAQYEKDKELYALDEDTYLVSYIVAQVTPSDEDRLEATQAVENALMGLRETQGIDAVSGNNKFVINRHNTAAKYLPSNLADRLESLAQDSVQQISFYDNKYTLAKLIGTAAATDSITFDMIALSESANADSIIEVLNAGTALDALPAGTVAQSQLAQRGSLLKNSQLSLLLGNAVDGVYYNAPDLTGTPTIVFRLVRKDAPVTSYNIAEITYQLEPSTTTVNNTQSRLRAYVEENADAKSFADNAVASNYMVLPTKVTKTSVAIDGRDDTGALVKWAVKAKNGQVSDVYSDNSKKFFYAGALTDKYSKGYTPLRDSQVQSQSRAKALRAKKAESLLAKYDGKAQGVDGYADAMSAKVDTVTVTFGQNYGRGFTPGDGKFIALATETAPGQITGPVATDYSVVVFEVIGENQPEREFDAVNNAMYFQQSQSGAQTMLRNWNQILTAKADIDNKIQKFTRE